MLLLHSSLLPTPGMVCSFYDWRIAAVVGAACVHEPLSSFCRMVEPPKQTCAQMTGLSAELAPSLTHSHTHSHTHSLHCTQRSPKSTKTYPKIADDTTTPPSIVLPFFRRSVLLSLRRYVVTTLRSSYLVTSLCRYVVPSFRRFVASSLRRYLVASLRHSIVPSLRRYSVSGLVTSLRRCLLSVWRFGLVVVLAVCLLSWCTHTPASRPFVLWH